MKDIIPACCVGRDFLCPIKKQNLCNLVQSEIDHPKSEINMSYLLCQIHSLTLWMTKSEIELPKSEIDM